MGFFNIRISELKERGASLKIVLGKGGDEKTIMTPFDFRNMPFGTAIRYTALLTGNPLVSDDSSIVIGK